MKTPWRRQAGISAVEIMVVVALIAVLAAVAVPSFGPMVDKYRVKTMASSVAAILQFARSEAVKSNTPVFVAAASGANSCVGARRAVVCDCTVTDTAAANYCEFKLLNAGDFSGVQVSAAAFGGNAYTRFDPVRGLVDGGSLSLTSRGGRQITVRLSGLGRVKFCSPAGASNVSEYPAC